MNDGWEQGVLHISMPPRASVRHVPWCLSSVPYDMLLPFVLALFSQAPPSASASPPIDWRTAEQRVLRNHVQLTFSDRFIKAGESYFSPDATRIVFQAVETPEPGKQPEDFYSMFIADVVRDAG